MAAHQGMVRCGHCMEAFDTRPNFVPDQLDLQLELPILDEPVTSDDSKIMVLQPMTLAEQVAFVQDENINESKSRHALPWAISTFLLLLILLAQAAYFFRVDLAARQPELKPALDSYCRILKCSIPLPQHADLVGIESSDLNAMSHENQFLLNALLRNRAPYAQAFPNLELTLNDNQDKPLARRIFRPADYLPSQVSEASGLLPNAEINIKLQFVTASLKPSGYRLMLFYPSP